MEARARAPHQPAAVEMEGRAGAAAAAAAGVVVVVLDGGLTIAEVVSEVWAAGGDVGEELVFYYGLRGAWGEEEEQGGGEG